MIVILYCDDLFIRIDVFGYSRKIRLIVVLLVRVDVVGLSHGVLFSDGSVFG